jgi:hypothetical protein
MVMIALAPALSALALAATPAPTHAAQPFDPAELQQAVQEQHTKLLILGSPHLAEIGSSFDVAWLQPLLAALERFAPDAIVVEALPTEALHHLVAYEELYPGVADMFAHTRLRLSAEASASLGIFAPAAEAAARKMLAQWPPAPAPAQRRRLAALFVAAGDLNSGLLQWLRLPAGERVAGDGISPALTAEFQKLMGSRNETVSIAVQLVARPGLERLHSMDDQSESDLVFSAMDAVVEAERSPALAAARARRPEPQFTAMTTPERVLAAYREHNSPQAGRRDAERQWRARLESGEHGHVHRRRIAGWETRNLRMAANIREASAAYPGKHILVLVGSAHKPYLEAYLSSMSDIRLVPAAEIIGGGR